jgi:hypothetical protein
MRRGREDQLSEASSRPAFLDEFERKLAAALARQTDEGKTRFGSARSSDINVEVPSSPSLGKAITPGSMGEEQALDVGPLQPLSETRETRTQISTAGPTRVSPPQGNNAHNAAKAPAAGGTADVHATQPAARLSDLGETSSAGRAVKSPTASSGSSATHEAPPAVAHSLPRGDGDGPTQEIGAPPGPVDSKAARTIDVEALLANVEASLANDAEVALVVKPANLHARAVAEVIKRFSRDWKLMASVCAFVSVAMVGVVTLSHGMLAVPDTPPRADEPSVRETMTRDDTADQALKVRTLEPSSAAEDRLGATSEGVGATASASQANEPPGAGATQAGIGLTNGAPPGSTPEASDPTGPASPLAPPAQPSGYKLAPADRTATATSSLAPPAQSLDPKPAPTVSPEPAPTPTSGTFPTEGSTVDQAPQPTAKPARNAHDVGTANLSAPRRDVPTKVVGKPSIGARVTKNDAASTPTATEKSNQALPVGTPTNPEKGPIASNVVQSPPAADPGASAQQPLDHPMHAIGRGGVLADPAASDPQNLDHLRHAIGGIFGTGAAPAQHSVDPTPRAD